MVRSDELVRTAGLEPARHMVLLGSNVFSNPAQVIDITSVFLRALLFKKIVGLMELLLPVRVISYALIAVGRALIAVIPAGRAPACHDASCHGRKISDGRDTDRRR